MAHAEQRQESGRSVTKRKVSIKVLQNWYVVLFNAISIPTLIIVLQLFFDVVPFYPEIGAFIMAAGSIAILSCFPLVARYKAANEAVSLYWHETRKLNKKALHDLVKKMYFVSAMALMPSLAGLFYFLATRDLIASFILCIPAIVMAVLCKPMLPEQVLAKLK